jgi:hypothetical protein
VRGVSWTGSESDCLLIDDVSVLLLLSAGMMLCDFGCRLPGWPEEVALPVMRRFLNAFTSIEARGMAFPVLSEPTNPSAFSCSCEMDKRNGSSIVANVRLNGLGGAFEARPKPVIDPDICSVSVLRPSSSVLDA